MDVRVEEQALPPSLGIVAFPVLKLVREARNEHGMRHQDWERYRRFCTKKTHRVRRALRLTHVDESSVQGKKASASKNRKRRICITPEMQRAADKDKSHAFTRKEIALEQIQDARPLELLLFEAEHCLASAEELWAAQDSSDISRAVLRRRSIARGRRAVQFAEKLEVLADAMNNHLDAVERAQCAAYVGLVKSAVLFIKGDWELALTSCAVTRSLFAKIAENSATSRDEALASSFLDALDAQVRFAAYSVDDKTGDTAAIVQRVATRDACARTIPGYVERVDQLEKEHAGLEATEPLHLKWRSHDIPLRSFEVHDTVAQVNKEQARLEQYLSEHGSTREPTQRTHAPRTRLSHAARNAKRAGGVRTIRSAGAQRANHGELDPFDRVLGALTDAEDAVRILVDDNAQALAKSHSARYEAAGQQLRHAHELILYRLLCVRIARNVRLADEVEAKALKRGAKARAMLDARLFVQAPSIARPSAKPSQPGARAKRPRTTPKSFKRKHARSGQHVRALALRNMQSERAVHVATAKAERRALRTVPGIAKLLENIDSSLLGIGGLVVVEGEPDVSSLMEAKRFYYNAVLLKYLARAFMQHSLFAEAALLLQRAELYVRQAAQSLELADGAEEEDKAFSPTLLGENVLDTLKAELVDTQRAVLNAMATTHAAPTTALRDTKWGKTIYHHALRHVSFDPMDLEHMRAQARELVKSADESTDAMDEAIDEVPADTVDAPNIPPADTPYDPANALEEEEERKLEAQQQPSSWLGWLRRT